MLNHASPQFALQPVDFQKHLNGNVSLCTLVCFEMKRKKKENTTIEEKTLFLLKDRDHVQGLEKLQPQDGKFESFIT